MLFRRSRRSTPLPAPPPTPAACPGGLAIELAWIAAHTSDPITRAHLNGIVPRVAAQEATFVALIEASCALAREMCQRP